MSAYGQFCPVAKACEVVGERWTPLVVRELLCGSHRFNEIRRGVPLMSPSLLAQRLRTLERSGIVYRQRVEGASAWAYHLTAAGEELRPLIEGLGVWGSRWVRSQLEADDLDPGLLMWDMRRRFDVSRLPDQRVTFAINLTDAAHKYRWWWLMVEHGEVDLCLEEPGYEIDLCVITDVRTMTEIWMGDTTLARAETTGKLQLQGPSRLQRAFKSCLMLSQLAGVKRAATAVQATGS